MSTLAPYAEAGSATTGTGVFDDKFLDAFSNSLAKLSIDYSPATPTDDSQDAPTKEGAPQESPTKPSPLLMKNVWCAQIPLNDMQIFVVMFVGIENILLLLQVLVWPRFNTNAG